MRTNAPRPADGVGGISAAPASPVTTSTGEHVPATTHGPASAIDDDLRWAAVSAEDPCPVCGASDGCGVAPCPRPGGIAVDCRRVVSDRPLTAGGWFHRLPVTAPADEAPAVEQC